MCGVYIIKTRHLYCVYILFMNVILYVACDEGLNALKLYFRSLQCSQSGVDDVEAVVEVGQLVEQQPGPGAGQGAGWARDNVVPAPPTGLG